MPKLSKQLIAEPGKKIKLSSIDPGSTGGIKDKSQAEAQLQKNRDRLAVLQNILYAEGRRGVQIVIQGIDAAGKDGTIRHVMSGLNPQGCRVFPFKAPSEEEKKH